MKRVLCDFFGESGQKVNIAKSRVWFSPNTPTQLSNQIVLEMGIPKTTCIGTYLGLPLQPRRLKINDMQFVLDKVKRRIGGWQHKLLSKASKLVLLQSVARTIPAYPMYSVVLPAATTDTLERLDYRFFLGFREEHWGVTPIAWNTICQPKTSGSLGLHSLKDTNQVLLAKSTWRFLKTPSALWAAVIRGKYGALNKLRCDNHRPSSSDTWKALRLGFELLEKGLSSV